VIESLVTKAEELDETLQEREKVFGVKVIEPVKDKDHECSSDGEENKDSSFVI
jgi:hypothetical protein